MQLKGNLLVITLISFASKDNELGKNRIILAKNEFLQKERANY